MSAGNKLPYVLAAVLAATTLISALLWRRDRSQLAELSKRTDEVCQRLEWDLQAIIANRTPIARRDLHVRMATHHLDQGLMQLCFGRPIVVATDDADACWIAHEGSGDECYVDVARALLEAYRARRH